MPEPRNPLDVIVEELAGLIARYETCATLMGTDPEYVSEATADARAALTLLRKLRADAVVGWAPKTAEAIKTCCGPRVMRMFSETVPLYGDVPALLIPFTDTENRDDD